jgi:hypothetical protein
MSIGFMLPEEKAVVWRGPMLMGALQQMLTQVEWGELDVLLVDLPPGTGDVAMTLCQKSEVTGAIVVSTPQDVALLDARKALNMFELLKTPVLGLIENMASYVCPNCGHEAHIFGEGGVRAEAERIGVPFLGELPISLETRIAGDAGTPIAAGDGADGRQRFLGSAFLRAGAARVASSADEEAGDDGLIRGPLSRNPPSVRTGCHPCGRPVRRAERSHPPRPHSRFVSAPPSPYPMAEPMKARDPGHHGPDWRSARVSRDAGFFRHFLPHLGKTRSIPRNFPTSCVCATAQACHQ